MQTPRIGATGQSDRLCGDASSGYIQQPRGHRPRRHRDLRASQLALGCKRPEPESDSPWRLDGASARHVPSRGSMRRRLTRGDREPGRARRSCCHRKHASGLVRPSPVPRLRSRPEAAMSHGQAGVAAFQGIAGAQLVGLALSPWTKGSSLGAGLPWPARDTSVSSNWEEIRGLGLAPAQSMRATAPDRLLTGASQTIGKRLLAVPSAPASYPSSCQSRTPRWSAQRLTAADALRPEIGEKHVAGEGQGRHLRSCSRGSSPYDGAGVAAYVRLQQPRGEHRRRGGGRLAPKGTTSWCSGCDRSHVRRKRAV
jgi:hypothetical protein